MGICGAGGCRVAETVVPRGAIGGPKAAKPYAHYSLATRSCSIFKKAAWRRPNFTRNMDWRPRSVQSLRKLWFADPKPPKVKLQNEFASQRSFVQKLCHGLVGPGV